MHTYLKIAVAVLLLIISNTNTKASNKDIYFKHLSTTDGLSQPSVISVWQDKLGNMWFGNNLLNRYDGNTITTFRISDYIDNLQDTNIKQICGDSKTTMYALVNNVLVKADYYTGSFWAMDIHAEYISVVNDTLYYAWQNKVYRYDAQQNKSQEVISLDSEIRCMAITPQQDYWIGTTNGVYKVSNAKQQKILSEENISCLFQDSQKNIWVGTRDNGVKIIKANGDTADLKQQIFANTDIPLNRIRTINEDNKHNIWIGTYNGIIIYTPATNSLYFLNNDEAKPYSLRNNSIFSIYKDQQGTMWAGTYYGGVSYFNPDIELYTYYATSKSNKNMLNGIIIGDMAQDKQGNLFIASEEGGLNILNKQKQTITRYDKDNSQLPHNTIKSLWYDSTRNKLYIGTFTEGLVVLNRSTNRLKRIGENLLKTFSQKVISQIIPYNDDLLISTQGGIYKLNCNTDELSTFGDPSIYSTSNLGFIYTMWLDEDHTLWLFSLEKGLFNINLSTNKTTTFEEVKATIKEKPIIKIKSDNKGKIYLLTDGAGMLVYDKHNQKFTAYNKDTNDILLSNICYNLAFTPSNKIVITSDKGITLFDPQQNQSNHLRVGEIFPLKSICASSGIFVSDTDTRIYVGGISGMISFTEKDFLSMSTSNKTHKLHLSSLAINNQPVTPLTHPDILKETIGYTKRIALSHDKNNVNISFASSDYIHSYNTKYEYILQGYDKQWTTTNDKTIRYTSLPPGKYKLLIRNYYDKAESLEVDLVIQPPFYASIWAYLIYTIVVLLILWYILRSAQRNMILRANLKVEHHEKERMKELNTMKNNFFANISHEFRTPLTLIISHLEMTLNSENITPTIKGRLQNIKKHTHNMQDLINELNDLRKTEEGKLSLHINYTDIVSFVNGIFASFKDYAHIKEINYTLESYCPKTEVWFDPYLMQKVVYNLLSNAFKFTNTGGTISVTLKETKTHIELTIQDTGLGIDQSDIDKIFERFYQVEQNQTTLRMQGMGIGLALSKSIVELHQGEILVASQPNIGTSFTVKLRRGGAHFDESQKTKSKQDIENRIPLPAIEAEKNEPQIQNNVNENQKSSILIIEDNEDLLQILVEAFTPIYRVSIATNGKEGLDKAKAQMPNIILTDIMMPQLSGLEICKQLKSHIETSHIPIILITALASAEQNIEGLKYGADDYITKPFDMEMLLLKCNNLVRSHKKIQYKFQNETSTEPVTLATNMLDQKIIDKSIAYINNNLSNENFDINQWAKELNMGRTKLFNKIKAITGLTPNEFILTLKMKKAAAMLKNNPETTITEIAYQLGFSSAGYFGKCFKEAYGVTPINYRNH